MTNLQLLLWTGLVLAGTSTAIGGIEWFKGRDRTLALVGASNVAVGVAQLGGGDPVWTYTCFAIAAVLMAGAFTTRRPKTI